MVSVSVAPCEAETLARERRPNRTKLAPARINTPIHLAVHDHSLSRWYIGSLAIALRPISLFRHPVTHPTLQLARIGVPSSMEIVGDSAEFEILLDLFRHFVIEIARLPEPTPPITGDMPAGRVLLALIDQSWSTLDKGLSPDEAVARTTGELAMAAADLSVKLAFLVAKARVGDERDVVASDAIAVLNDVVRYLDVLGTEIADLSE